MREGFQKRGMLTGQLRSTDGCRRGRQGREEAPAKTQGNADQRSSQHGCGLAASASPGSLLEMSISRPPLDQPHLWGGAQHCVRMSSPGDPDAHSSLRTTEWERALFSLHLADKGPDQVPAPPCLALSLPGAGRKEAWGLPPIPSFLQTSALGVWEVGGGAAHPPSPRLLRPHTQGQQQLGFCLNPSHASSLLACPSDPQLDAARAGGRGEELSRGGREVGPL